MDGFDEDATIVLCAEIAQAMQIARPIYADGDRVGARMAFRSAYERLIADGRAAGRPAEWWPSIGFNAGRREPALRAAVERGLLSAERAAAYLPAPIAPAAVALLTADSGTPLSDDDREKVRGILAGMRTRVGRRA
jgi:hypothetical protein